MDFVILLTAFFFGFLTVLAPCVFPLLPIILGGSLKDKNPLRPWIITGSLVVSIVIFTLLLQGLSLILSIPSSTLKYTSGGLVIAFGMTFLFPNWWNTLAEKCRFQKKSESLLSQTSQKKGFLGMILLGASLGPVFTSCSPTYSLILAIILPASFFQGTLYLTAYALGLGVVLGLIAYFGQSLTRSLSWASNPQGWFKKFLGILFILIGMAITQGYDKKFEAFIIKKGLFIDLNTFESGVTEKLRSRISPLQGEARPLLTRPAKPR